MTRETRARRAPRNEPHLIVNRSGVHCIAWGRAVARAAGVARVESLGTTDRRAAELKMRERQAEVFTSLGDDRRADRVRRQLFPVGMRAMVSTFLRALAAGELPPLPAKKTLLDMYVPGMMGRSSFCDFAESVGAISSTDMNAALVERWLDQLRVKGLSADTLRLRRQCARRLAQFATTRGHISEAAAAGILAVKRVRGARGRARTDERGKYASSTRRRRRAVASRGTVEDARDSARNPPTSPAPVDLRSARSRPPRSP